MKIKVIFTIIFILLYSQLAFSKSPPLEEAYPTFHVICKNVEVLSREVMMCRQDEMPKDRVLEILGKYEWDHLDVVVDKAYQAPLYTKNKKNDASWRFGEKQYSICMKNLISQRFDPFEIGDD